jgi:hypothetical protein
MPAGEELKMAAMANTFVAVGVRYTETELNGRGSIHNGVLTGAAGS